MSVDADGTAGATEDVARLPAYPGRRAEGCPFDPPANYARWRDEPGLARAVYNGIPAWVVSRHDDIVGALADPRVSADVRGPLLALGLTGDEELPPMFPRMDGEEHLRRRRMMVRDFTAGSAEKMRPRITEMADGFIDAMVAQGAPSDLVTDYALPIPSLVISDLLGVPYEDADFFQEKSSIGFDLSKSPEEHLQARADLFLYTLELAQKKEKEPGDDLISRLVHEQVLTGTLSWEAVAMNASILLNAGHETTSNMIALGVLTLLEHPETLARVRDTDDPGELRRAIEELMRHLSIVQGFVTRVAAEDVEIGGQVVRAGEGMVMNLPGGNRDPQHFADPDLVDIDRDARGQLGFGSGVHQCLGQTLARVELEVALQRLLRRLPDLRLAVPLSEVPFRAEMSTYGVHALPVTWA